MALELSGKAALVTGGGSGICLELTRKLLKAGCSVTIADLALRAEAKEVVAEWKEGRVIFVQTDVTNWQQLQAAFDKTMEAFGRLDIVVPGAGIFEPVCILPRLVTRAVEEWCTDGSS
jgi:NAD(P)-dependent dehydrogenase (short-subunit alcohol dehydrogenase family)